MGKTLRAQEPVAAYVVDEDRLEAKLFANGRSQAIRLPRQFRLPGSRVLIHREGKRLIVEPLEEVERDAMGHPLGIFEELRALIAGQEDGWECPADPVPAPMPATDDSDWRAP